jgi:hypothetical protein
VAVELVGKVILLSEEVTQSVHVMLLGGQACPLAPRGKRPVPMLLLVAGDSVGLRRLLEHLLQRMATLIHPSAADVAQIGNL